jgi:predicted nucleic acid-binding protein
VNHPVDAVLDTSVIIDFEHIDGEAIAGACGRTAATFHPAISAITLAELASGPHTTGDPAERAVRQARLQWTETHFNPLWFDDDAARSYGLMAALSVAYGRKPRKRLADLLIAATAHASRVPLVTRNPDDFLGLEAHVRVIAA